MNGILKNLFAARPDNGKSAEATTGQPDTGAAEAALAKLSEVLAAAANGDLEARVTGIDEAVPGAEAMHALNQLLDMTDAYVRETRASLDAAQEGRFHRLFLQRGMRGVFAQGAGIINASIARMQQAAAEEQERARRQAERLEAAKGFGEHLDSTVEKLSEAASRLDELAQGLQSRMERMIDEGEQSAANAREALEGAQAVASGAHELASSIEEIARQAAESDQAVRQVREDVGNAVNATEKL
ncbi:MAG: hypothetical protein D6757_03475, partial [Alphaproteobacteria bacterium]